MKLEPSNELDTIASLYHCTPEQFERKLINYLKERGIIYEGVKGDLITDIIKLAGYDEFNIMLGCFEEHNRLGREYFEKLKLI